MRRDISAFKKLGASERKLLLHIDQSLLLDIDIKFQIKIRADFHIKVGKLNSA